MSQTQILKNCSSEWCKFALQQLTAAHRHMSWVVSVNILAAENQEDAAVLANGPVAIDVCVRPETRAVIITGPNTGGKTATLKVRLLLADLHSRSKSGGKLPSRLWPMLLSKIGSPWADAGHAARSVSKSVDTPCVNKTSAASGCMLAERCRRLPAVQLITPRQLGVNFPSSCQVV